MPKRSDLSGPTQRIRTDADSYRKTTFPDGIRVVTESIPYARSASIGMWLMAGTRDESVTNNGISHFIEHMLFKGTRRRSSREIAQSIENVGGHLNAFTGKEVTCYYAHMLDKDLPLAIDVLADMLTESVLADSEILKEKQVVAEEIDAVEDIPEDRIHEYFQADLFGTHSLGLRTLGSKETLAAFDRDALFSFTKTHYAKDRLVIAAAGRVEHEQICDLVADRFATWQHSSARYLVPPVAVEVTRCVREEDVLQSHLCVGSRGFAFADTRKFPALVLNTLLGEGMGSRLFQTVREDHGLCYEISAYLEFFTDTGLFYIYTAADFGKIERTLELILLELAKLRSETITAYDLERTKSQLIGNLMLGLESTASRMNRLAKMEIYLNCYYELDQVIDEIGKVTALQVKEVAEFLFGSERLVTTMINATTSKKTKSQRRVR